MLTVETSNAFSEFSKSVLNSTPRSLDITKQTDLESKYLFNPTFAGIEEADVVLTVGTNMRTEAPLLNARLRKQWLKDNVSVAHIGPTLNLTFPVKHLGLTLRTFIDIVQGKHPFSAELLRAKKPVIIFSPSFFRQEEVQAHRKSLDIIVKSIPNIQTPGWNGLAVLDIEANTSAVGFLPTSFLQENSVEKGITFLLNSEDRLGYKRDFIENGKVENYLFDKIRNDSKWLVYAGHHGTELTAKADIVIPTSLYLEDEGHHLNMEGRYQQSAKVTTSPGKAQSETELIDVIRYLFNQQMKNCEDKQNSITNSDYYLFEPSKVQNHDFVDLKSKPKGLTFNETHLEQLGRLKSTPTIQYLNDAPLKPVVTEFYQTDTISKHSSTMSDCSKKYGSTINFQE
jgi:NADH dehydrogenase/NADH:ubiquinone oxidoreductase subunit G